MHTPVDGKSILPFLRTPITSLQTIYREVHFTEKSIQGVFTGDPPEIQGHLQALREEGMGKIRENEDLTFRGKESNEIHTRKGTRVNG